MNKLDTKPEEAVERAGYYWEEALLGHMRRLRAGDTLRLRVLRAGQIVVLTHTL